MVTCGTYKKQNYLKDSKRREYFLNLLLELSNEYDWIQHAWAIMSNHYHFIAQSPDNPDNLKDFILHLHSLSATEFNREDNKEGRQVWYQYWDSKLTYQKSYLARLKYVHNNPVHHGLVDNAEDYHWCSASWFKSRADYAFRNTVESFKIDKLNVYDDY